MPEIACMRYYRLAEYERINGKVEKFSPNPWEYCDICVGKWEGEPKEPKKVCGKHAIKLGWVW